MSAIEVFRMARERGVRLGVAGSDLVLNADREPGPQVLDAIRRNKAGIMALITAPENGWSAEDWQAFFAERAAIAEHDGKVTRADAETNAYESCVLEWLNQNPGPSEPGRCAWCDKTEATSGMVVPFGTTTHGHRWLHSHCWANWYEHRRSEATIALEVMGVMPTVVTKSAKVADEAKP